MPSVEEEPPPLPPPAQGPAEEPTPPIRVESYASAPSQPASDLVRRALQPECSVDFPQITEICERLEIQPAEIRTTVAVLSKALRDRRRPLQVKLKALTIAHEMLYNPQVVEVFAESEGLREALEGLRQVRGGEHGAAMDENVRMLATEIVGRCFEGKTGSNGWSSFAKAMGSDFEKARKAARKNFQHLSQKAEKQMEKAERVFERGAVMLMQEAENMLAGPTQAPQAPPIRGPEKPPALTTEEEQLQWALRQSLKEAKRQKPSGGYSTGSNPLPDAEAQTQDLPPQLAQADSRAQALEEALGALLTAEDADAKETAQLSIQLEETLKQAQSLATRLSEAEYELSSLKKQREMLEEQVLCARSEQSHIDQLRNRLSELEAQVAASPAASAPTSSEKAGLLDSEPPTKQKSAASSCAAAEVEDEVKKAPACTEEAAEVQVACSATTPTLQEESADPLAAAVQNEVQPPSAQGDEAVEEKSIGSRAQPDAKDEVEHSQEPDNELAEAGLLDSEPPTKQKSAASSCAAAEVEDEVEKTPACTEEAAEVQVACSATTPTLQEESADPLAAAVQNEDADAEVPQPSARDDEAVEEKSTGSRAQPGGKDKVEHMLEPDNELAEATMPFADEKPANSSAAPVVEDEEEPGADGAAPAETPEMSDSLSAPGTAGGSAEADAEHERKLESSGSAPTSKLSSTLGEQQQAPHLSDADVSGT